MDTNICAIKLASLAEEVPFHTGDAMFCGHCKAVLNKSSCLSSASGGLEKSWCCEFCEAVNVLDLDDHEIPTLDSVDYILRVPESPTTSVEESLVVFCVDISGSMCVSTEVPGNLMLRDQAARQSALAQEVSVYLCANRETHGYSLQIREERGGRVRCSGAAFLVHCGERAE